MAPALLFDTSVLIPLINSGTHERVFRQAVRTGRALLCSVVSQELYAGTAEGAAKKALDAIDRAFARAGAVVTPAHEDWCRAGVLVARYGRLYGHIAPRDHVADILIMLCASRAAAILVTENVVHMRRWASLLRPRRRGVVVTTPEGL